jgi:hypothetical protein
MNKAFFLILMAFGVCHADTESCAAAREKPNANRDWHLLTITEGGTVTLLKKLTHKEAEFARARALGEDATVEQCDATDARIADEKRRNEEALRKRHPPVCPADATEPRMTAVGDAFKPWDAWDNKHKDACGCVNADGTVQIWCDLLSSNNGYLISTWANPGRIKSAEVFR